MKRVIGYLVVSAVLVAGGLVVTGQVSLNTFTAGEVISSEAVNQNFQRLATGLEGKQTRVEASCSEGSSVRVINADGTVECEVDSVGEAGSSGVASVNGKTDAVVIEGGSNVSVDDSQEGKVIINTSGSGGGDITEVKAGSGLAGGGDSGSVTLSVDAAQLQSRVSGTCPSGESIREIKADGTVTCEVDDTGAGGATYSAGDGLSLTDTTFSVDFGGAGSETTAAHSDHDHLGQTWEGKGRGLNIRVEDQASRAVQGHSGDVRQGVGVQGMTAPLNIGVTLTQSAGVFGYSGWSSGKSDGVFGSSRSSEGYGGRFLGGKAGIYAKGNSGLAAEFEGNVSIDGDLNVTGTVSPPSSRALKTGFQAVDSLDILHKVSQMDISTWVYKADEDRALHLGPVAEDFYAAFGLGQSDARISTIDADGVALAAVQGLYRIVQEKDAQIAALEARLEVLEAALGVQAASR